MEEIVLEIANIAASKFLFYCESKALIMIEVAD